MGIKAVAKMFVLRYITGQGTRTHLYSDPVTIIGRSEFELAMRLLRDG